MQNFTGVPCVESLLEETQQLQSSAPYRLGLNAVSACTFWGMLQGPILQSFNVQNSPGHERFGSYSRLRSTASRIEHQGEDPLARMDLKSQFTSLLLFCVCVAFYLKWISKGYHFKYSGFYIPRAEFPFAPQVDSSKINGPKWIFQRESKSHANLASLIQ